MPRHLFLLDENIFPHAIRGVDRFDEPDQTARELIKNIAHRCHRIVVNGPLSEKYWNRLKGLKREKRPESDETLRLVRQILAKGLKVAWAQATDAVSDPASAAVPAKDAYLVELARASGAILVSADEGLVRATQAAKGQLGVDARWPHEAMPLAEQPADD